MKIKIDLNKFVNKKCSDILPENYYLDKGDNIYKECFQSCKKCHQSGTETNHNCDECKNGYTFLGESSIDKHNCLTTCGIYYFLDKLKDVFNIFLQN